MFLPATNSAKGTRGGKGNFSESDSDWDTTVDYPVPGQGGGEDKTDNSDDDDDLPVQPKPKTRASLTDKGKEDKAGDGAPHSGKGDRSGTPGSANKRNLKTPASASAVRLSTFDSDSRDASPEPPFNFGFPPGAAKNEDNKTKKSSPSSAGRNQKKNRHEMSPTPKVPASMEVGIPKWDDSDAEQRTLQELHKTLKKEKTREIGNKAARKQIQEGGDNSQAMDHSLTVMEKPAHGKEEKMSDRAVMEVQEDTVTEQKQKREKRGFLASWLRKDAVSTDAVTGEENAPYQPFIIKNADGKRFVYCFSEGSTAFYEVVEEDSEAVMPRIAEKVEGYIKRGWQEFFGMLRILTSIFIFLVVEALSFVTDHLARPVFLGLLMTTGNRLIKPLLAGLFNLILQPAVIFLWNLMSGLRHALQPVIDILGGVMTKIAVPLQAFRLVEVNLGSSHAPNQRVLRLEGGGGVRNNEIV